MEDEIGHVCVRLFEKDGKFNISTMAYMGRKLSEAEARHLTRLWNDINAFLRSRSPQKKNEEEEEEE